MPIQLSQEERAFLEQFVRPYMPTKRQRAKALLGLAADEVPEAVASRLGIPKEVVLELAARFSERGLAGVGLEKRPEIVVTFVQNGVTPRRYRLPEGSTLADLLRRTGAATRGHSVHVDDITQVESFVLKNEETVIVFPAPETSAGDVPEHAAMPSLQDDLIFEEYRDILKARRAERAREEDSA
jgi:hypothetical protein